MKTHSPKESNVNRKFLMRIDFIIHWQLEIRSNCMQRLLLLHIIAVAVIRSAFCLLGFSSVSYVRIIILLHLWIYLGTSDW